jgi:hypothetical protein
MKKFLLISAVITMVSYISCTKADTAATDTSITASTTTASVGQTVSLQVTTPANAVSWTVTPSATAVTQYSITVEKNNTVSFTQAGTYLVGVRARNINYDSTRHQDLDSCWHHGNGDMGNCTKGKDSASVIIYVK